MTSARAPALDLGLDSPSTPPGYSNNLRGHGRIHRHIVLRKEASPQPLLHDDDSPSGPHARRAALAATPSAILLATRSTRPPASPPGEAADSARACPRAPWFPRGRDRRRPPKTSDPSSRHPAIRPMARCSRGAATGGQAAAPRSPGQRPRGAPRAERCRQSPSSRSRPQVGLPLPLQLPAELRCPALCPCPALRGNRGTRGSNGELVTRMRRKSHRVPPCRRLLQAPRSRSHPCSWT